MKKFKRSILIVLDSAGVGELPDASKYGDVGCNTLGNLAKNVGGLHLPNLEKLGLGKIVELKGVSNTAATKGAFGKSLEASSGKDTTIGHWEMAGVITKEPFPTYPNGFPPEIVNEFEKRCNRKTIGNCVASGTEIIDQLGDEHVKSGALIVYTSADSVFQIAAHEDIVPISELYRYCEIAREMLAVGRIIARPFNGKSGSYSRTANRHDYSLNPPETMLDRLQAKKIPTIGVGKIFDIFNGKGVSEAFRTKSNKQGMEETLRLVTEGREGLIFVNLVDFDMKYGHRRDCEGYNSSLVEFDAQLGELLPMITNDDLLIITADHGCDPTFKGTDHTREYIPILAFTNNIKSVDLGIRSSFQDISATIEEALIGSSRKGSFLSAVV